MATRQDINRRKKTAPIRKSNPFTSCQHEKGMVVFNAGVYQVGVLMLLSPPALRCFLVLASELKPDGSSSATLAELKKRIGHPMATLSKAVRSLIHLDLIAKKAQSCYWVDGTFFYTLNLHTR